MKKITLLISAILLITLMVSPVFAKDYNLPVGQSKDYYSQGEGYISVPAGALFANSPATTLKVICNEVTDGTLGPATCLGLSMPWPNPESTQYIPLAWFVASSNPESANQVVAFLKVLLKGFPSAVCVPMTAPTAIAGLNNTKVISNSIVSIERHGNSISAQLTQPIDFLYPSSTGKGGVKATLPAFSIEFDKVGGSVHTEKTLIYNYGDQYSKYTQMVEHMGFCAVGAFTCSAWSYIEKPMTNCFIAMHGTSVYIPPS
jgi:hypothetical protein